LLQAGRLPDLLATTNRDWRCKLLGDWGTFAHTHQREPVLAHNGRPWTTWLMLGGRGAGKTRAGAEWVRALAADPDIGPNARIALVGETEHDVREVMIEGVSGLLAVCGQGLDKPQWLPSRRRLEWPSGAVAQAFSADNYESLRGPQFSHAWLDELAKWKNGSEAFDQLQFGLRLGSRPRAMITTTPRPSALIKRLIADPSCVVTHAGTQANKYNLAPAFLDTVLARYGGTRLGRQEIEGAIVEERTDALWTRAMLEGCRIAAATPLTELKLSRIVVAVDPPVSSGKHADACGLVAAGRTEEGTIYVVADETCAGLSPHGWARRAVALWRRLDADALVVEVNQGGDLVKTCIAEVDAAVPVTAVRAHRGKYLRAEPVAQLFEQGRVRLCGAFPALEDEMCDFGPDGLSSSRSPDRLDALVWAVTSLSFGARVMPRVRGL
jgi:phage terminase large subunit-like protein